MPAKFLIQRKVSRFGLLGGKKLWIDTEWTSLALARSQWKDYEFREVMVQW